MGWKSYCSKRCQYKSLLTGKVLSCSNPDCGKKFYRWRNQIAKMQKSYCSRSCAVQVNNRVNPKRTKEWHQCANKLCNRQTAMYHTFCSKKCLYLARTAYTSDELMRKLKDTFQTLGRTPAKREMRSIADMCVRAFGSWNNALLAAGFTPHRSHSNRMYKRTNTIALDGHRCDSVSEALIDNWLTKNGVAHFRDVPYPSTGHKADWGIGEHVFIEYFGLAKNSPRYDRTIRKKRKLCQEHRIKLVEIFASDLYPTEKLGSKLKPLLRQSAAYTIPMFEKRRAVVYR